MTKVEARILREHIESAETAIETIEIDLADLTDEHATEALRKAQAAYRALIADLRMALNPLG